MRKGRTWAIAGLRRGESQNPLSSEFRVHSFVEEKGTSVMNLGPAQTYYCQQNKYRAREMFHLITSVISSPPTYSKNQPESML